MKGIVKIDSKVLRSMPLAEVFLSPPYNSAKLSVLVAQGIADIMTKVTLSILSRGIGHKMRKTKMGKTRSFTPEAR